MATNDLKRNQLLTVVGNDNGVYRVEVHHDKELVVSLVPQDLSEGSAKKIAEFIQANVGLITNPSTSAAILKDMETVENQSGR